MAELTIELNPALPPNKPSFFILAMYGGHAGTGYMGGPWGVRRRLKRPKVADLQARTRTLDSISAAPGPLSMRGVSFRPCRGHAAVAGQGVRGHPPGVRGGPWRAIQALVDLPFTGETCPLSPTPWPWAGLHPGPPGRAMSAPARPQGTRQPPGENHQGPGAPLVPEGPHLSTPRRVLFD